jgi:nitrous oxidase accessory protein NosD
VLIGWGVDVQNVVVRNGTVSSCDDGILLWFTDHVTVTRMHLEDNVDNEGYAAGGITLVGATNSRISHNTSTGNYAGIRSFTGTGNRIWGNYTYWDFSAIELNYETDTIVKCNTVEQSYFGISAGPFSTGNILKGNLVTDSSFGIMLYGIEDPPDPIILPVASGNLVKSNVAEGNYLDLSEIVYNLDTDGIYVHPDDTCRNAWMNNQFGSELGPGDCIGASVELDEDDVCALDDD